MLFDLSEEKMHIRDSIKFWDILAIINLVVLSIYSYSIHESIFDALGPLLVAGMIGTRFINGYTEEE